MKDNKHILISIREINEISFFLNPISIPIDRVEFGVNLTVGIGFRFDVNPEDGIFKFYTIVHYSLKEQKDPIVGIETEIVFDVQNMSSVLKKESSELFQIENKFLASLAGVTIGTTRGLLAANTKGSPMARFPLPVVNPAEIIKNLNKSHKESR